MARVSFFLLLCLCVGCSRTPPLTPDQVEVLAKDAYIFAYPMLQNYQTLDRRFFSVASPANTYVHRTQLLDPAFTTIVAPNNDTLYSSALLDLRTEPVVLSVPAVPESRYYSIQLVDMYTHNLGYIGQRATGNEAGNYLVVGPHTPESFSSLAFDGIYYAESDLIFAIGRTLATDTADQQVAADLQSQYRIQPLSVFEQQAPPESAPVIAFPPFDADAARSPEFIGLLNFLLQFIAIHPDEQILFSQFAAIGIGAGLPFDSAELDEGLQLALAAGVQTALQEIEAESRRIGSQVNGWNTTFAGFGPREIMQGRYLLRAAAAMIGLYGNNREENSSFSRPVDAEGETLDGSRFNYQLHFPADALPPTNAFWSLTLYRSPEILLYANELNRYSIGDRTDGLRYGDDGSLTIHIQNTAPAPDANWLPAPAGPFLLALRNYLPDAAVYTGGWMPPQIERQARE